ncbi:unnamed protein product [Arabis nemorensis]|uniref:Uncharacterized protein n=1 Tax=Arabis nemorensis TaxID=586526 RepID=A0A565CP64_9BRAS|nr:unnamed protein product [Arabis nemorensis]
MNQNIKNEAFEQVFGSKDAFEQVFGPEHSGRVRCVGHGPIPSKYFKRLETQTPSAAEMVEIKSYVKRLEDKVDTEMVEIKRLEDKVDTVASALHTLVLRIQPQAKMAYKDSSLKLEE